MPTKFALVAGCLLVAGMMGFAGVAAQEPGEGAAKPKVEKDRRKPLPTYYGQIGVNDEQRERLTAVQAEYESKLEALREQLKKLVQERDAKMADCLTPGQKLRLKELQDEAKTRSAKTPPTPQE